MEKFSLLARFPPGSKLSILHKNTSQTTNKQESPSSMTSTGLQAPSGQQLSTSRFKSLYLIGSLRNETVTSVGNSLRELGIDVFDDWMAAGPEADDYWKKYEVSRGRSYAEALRGYAARHVFSFDKYHLDRCDAACLVLPAGKSGHLELGYVIGSGKPGYILLDGEDTRFDVMYLFANKVFMSKEEMIEYFTD